MSSIFSPSRVKMANINRAVLLIIVLCFVSLFSQQASAQNKKANSKNITTKIAQFVEKAGTYTKFAEGVWTIPYQGKSIKNIEVLVIAGTEIELVIMAVKVAKKNELPLKQDLLYKILRFSADQVKVIIDDDGDLVLQAEINARLTDYKEFSTVINQVAAAADQLHGQIKSSLTLAP